MNHQRAPQHAVRGTRRRGRVAGSVIAAAAGCLIFAVALAIPFLSGVARRKVVAVLGRQLDADVELTDLSFRLFPRFRAEGHGLAIRHEGRRDVPPLIRIKQFSAEGNIVGLLRKHIARVVIEELDIAIPPDHDRDGGGDGGADSNADQSSDRGGPASGVAPTFVIDQLVSNEARLIIIPGEPDQPQKVWTIHHLRMTSAGLGRSMPFVATLTNGVPPGEIETSGSFGPWQSGEPGKTPLHGTFTFDRADLGVFKGIAGILSARGSYGGTLERIDVRGESDTPQFTVMAGGHAIPLHATYHAIVNGTNGNTTLDEVDASFLHTSLVAKGGVIGTPGVDGRTVTLDVVMDRGRLEDVLLMAINTPKPPMTGALNLTTKLVLPPGDRDVVQKLRLDGTFTIAGTRFASSDVQAKINELSHRTRGETPDQRTERVSSHFAGSFTLADGTLSIPDVAFDVPGSAIRLSGSYGLVSEKIDFAGTAYTDARISEMTTGSKRVLLKPFDLIFKRNGGGAAIPIKITGTRGDPSFGLDTRHVFTRQ
jgi:AsmA-like C-terminal region